MSQTESHSYNSTVFPRMVYRRCKLEYREIQCLRKERIRSFADIPS